jgi:hypothetical protein
MRLVEQVGFASAFSFKYSRRPGTPGSAMDDQLPEAVKSARLHALQALLAQQARAFNASKVGAIVPVLFAELGRKSGQLIGKTPWLQSVYAEGNPRLIGHIVETPHRRGPCQQPGRRDPHRRVRGRGVSVTRRVTFDDNSVLVELYGVHRPQPGAP